MRRELYVWSAPQPVGLVRSLAEANGRTVWEEFLDLDNALTSVEEAAQDWPTSQAGRPL
ncbi:MAG: hypothetical protein ACJ736_11055 [Streptomyces sp.]